MARDWLGLGATTRTRYERAGISQQAYESGASLKAARGHASTPERPAEALRQPERYESYNSIRNKIADLKKEMYGPNAMANIPKGASRRHLEKTVDILQKKIAFGGSWDEFWEEFDEYDRDDYEDVEFYH